MHGAVYKTLPCYLISTAEFCQEIALRVKGMLLILFKSLLKVVKSNLLKVLPIPPKTHDPQLFGLLHPLKRDLIVSQCHTRVTQTEAGTQELFTRVYSGLDGSPENLHLQRTGVVRWLNPSFLSTAGRTALHPAGPQQFATPVHHQ